MFEVLDSPGAVHAQIPAAVHLLHTLAGASTTSTAALAVGIRLARQGAS